MQFLFPAGWQSIFAIIISVVHTPLCRKLCRDSFSFSARNSLVGLVRTRRDSALYESSYRCGVCNCFFQALAGPAHRGFYQSKNGDVMNNNSGNDCNRRTSGFILPGMVNCKEIPYHYKMNFESVTGKASVYVYWDFQAKVLVYIMVRDIRNSADGEGVELGRTERYVVPEREGAGKESRKNVSNYGQLYPEKQGFSGRSALRRKGKGCHRIPDIFFRAVF